MNRHKRLIALGLLALVSCKVKFTEIINEELPSKDVSWILTPRDENLVLTISDMFKPEFVEIGKNDQIVRTLRFSGEPKFLSGSCDQDLRTKLSNFYSNLGALQSAMLSLGKEPSSQDLDTVRPHLTGVAQFFPLTNSALFFIRNTTKFEIRASAQIPQVNQLGIGVSAKSDFEKLVLVAIIPRGKMELDSKVANCFQDSYKSNATYDTALAKFTKDRIQPENRIEERFYHSTIIGTIVAIQLKRSTVAPRANITGQKIFEIETSLSNENVSTQYFQAGIFDDTFSVDDLFNSSKDPPKLLSKLRGKIKQWSIIGLEK